MLGRDRIGHYEKAVRVKMCLTVYGYRSTSLSIDKHKSIVSGYK